ncbi:MAG: riboflavin synthase [Candidatus Sulfomarinibacteraceae bacterium]
MFTGLIETIGTVRRLNRSSGGARLEVEVRWPDDSTPAQGDSIAVNGACLTAIDPSERSFCADLSSETLARTLLAELRPGASVNLERALRLGDRFGGHIVQGHVDAHVRLVSVHPEGGFQRWRIALPPEHAREIASKGSVALDGVSLTVSSLGVDWFEVALIPETLSATTLGTLTTGSRLHLETDVLAKYVARRLGDPTTTGRSSSAIEELFGGGVA